MVRVNGGSGGGRDVQQDTAKKSVRGSNDLELERRVEERRVEERRAEERRVEVCAPSPSTTPQDMRGRMMGLFGSISEKTMTFIRPDKEREREREKELSSVEKRIGNDRKGPWLP